MISAMTEELHGQINSVLVDLLSRAEAEAVFLCDRGGNILARHSENPYEREDNMAALAAGSFYANREMARLLGEAEFQCVVHEGDQNSVYMQSTAFDMLMLVIFGKESNPGLVRLYASESCQGLDQLISSAESDHGKGAPPTGTIAFEIDTTKQPFSRASGAGC